MKIVLTTLPKKESAISWAIPKYFQPDDAKHIPLGLLSLATNMPSHHDIKILDPHSRNWSLDETIEHIENENPDICGISAETFKAYAMKEILQRTSAPYKVVGGHHTTHNSKQILNQGADACFVGQLADNEFAEAIEKQPKGVVYCKTKINDLIFPNRDFLEIDFYEAKGNLFKSNKRLSMFSGVGCPHHCTFCDVQTKKVERKNPSSVIDEMIYLQKLGAGSIHIYEDNFNTNKEYLKRICNEMDKKDFFSEWSGRGQAKMSPEVATMLTDHGFKRIHVGLESLSDKTLKFFRKNQTYADIENFCNTVTKKGIDILGFFIVGAPTETEEDRKNMSRRMKSLGIKHPLVNILQPFPNTEYYRDLLKDGIYKKDHWAEYIENPTPNFMLPFQYGEKKWKEDAAFIESIIQDYKKD